MQSDSYLMYEYPSLWITVLHLKVILYPVIFASFVLSSSSFIHAQYTDKAGVAKEACQPVR